MHYSAAFQARQSQRKGGSKGVDNGAPRGAPLASFARKSGSAASEAVGPQGLELGDGGVRQRSTRQRLDRLVELLEPGDAEHPAVEIAVVEHEAQRRLRRAAVRLAQRT